MAMGLDKAFAIAFAIAAKEEAAKVEDEYNKWYVALPNPYNINDVWVDVETFETKQEAIDFVVEKYGASEDGKLDIISGGTPEKELEPMTPKEYIEAGGTKCPVCRYKETEMHVDRTKISHDRICHKCNARWIDKYSLVNHKIKEKGAVNHEQGKR